MSIENVNHICINCMREKPDDGVCPFCGFDETQYEPSLHHLTPRSILGGKCLVGRVLGEGGFGITYIGLDLNLDLKLAIKEYYPTGYVTRTSTATSTVTPFRGEKTEFFTLGRSRFINEAKTLAKFYALPGIVSVRDFFLENSTAYIVMEFVEGETFKQMLAQNGGRMDTAEALELMRPLMRSLAEMHASGLIHRDISPDNIMVTPENNVKLIDFGAARDYLDSGNRSLSVMLKPGFAPEEQYFSRGQQGPWTDIYALCATIYRAITGVTPQESVERRSHDELKAPSALGTRISPAQEKTLLRGLSVAQEARWQSLPEFYAALFPDDGSLMHIRTQGAPVVTNQANQAKQPMKTNSGKAIAGIGSSLVSRWKEFASKPDSLKKMLPIGIAVVLAIALLISLLGGKPGEKQSLEGSKGTATNAAAADATTETTDVSSDEPYQVFPLKRRALVPASEQDALFQKAVKLLDEGKFAQAMATYDFSQRISAASNPISGSGVIRSDGLLIFACADPDRIDYFNKVGSGVSLTVGQTATLHKDGTVSIAFADADKLTDWSDIVQISSNIYFVIGLRSDGTAITYLSISTIAPGVDEAENWSDLVAVSAGMNHASGLKSDGTVVTCGFELGNVIKASAWTDIVAIDDGSYYVAGLRSDGTVITTASDSFDVSDWSNIIALSAGPSLLAGIDMNGNIHLTGSDEILSKVSEAQNWKNLVALSVGDQCIVGLQSDGTVVATGFGDVNEYNLIKNLPTW